MKDNFKRLQVSVQVVREGKAQQEESIKTPEDVAKLVGSLRQKDREHFLCIYLDTRNIVLGIETVSIGSLNASLVHPRECFKAAIVLNAAAIILCHNHPSGCAEPSQEDIEVTRRLVNAGELLGIEILDHVIIGNGSWFSFKDKSLI